VGHCPTAGNWVTLEMRTVAGPASVVQRVLRGARKPSDRMLGMSRYCVRRRARDTFGSGGLSRYSLWQAELHRAESHVGGAFATDTPFEVRLRHDEGNMAAIDR
jgi:hypothetical protein